MAPRVRVYGEGRISRQRMGSQVTIRAKPVCRLGKRYKAAFTALASISFLASSLRIRLRIFPLGLFGIASTNLTPPSSAL